MLAILIHEVIVYKAVAVVVTYGAVCVSGRLFLIGSAIVDYWGGMNLSVVTGEKDRLEDGDAGRRDLMRISEGDGGGIEESERMGMWELLRSWREG